MSGRLLEGVGQLQQYGRSGQGLAEFSTGQGHIRQLSVVTDGVRLFSSQIVSAPITKNTCTGIITTIETIITRRPPIIGNTMSASSAARCALRQCVARRELDARASRIVMIGGTTVKRLSSSPALKLTAPIPPLPAPDSRPKMDVAAQYAQSPQTRASSRSTTRANGLRGMSITPVRTWR